jgi:transcription antitermination factor NusA-like protein
MTEYGDKTVSVIRWSDDPETLTRNALHATRVDKVILHEIIRELNGMTDALTDGLVEQGFLSCDDLSSPSA